MPNQFPKPGADERLDQMLSLREQLDTEHQRVSSCGSMDDDFLATLHQFIVAGRDLSDWSLIIRCCNSYREYWQYNSTTVLSHGDRIDNLRLLAKAYQQLGMFSEAEACLQVALLEYYQHQSLCEDYQCCLRVKQSLPDHIKALHHGKLLLTPMRTCHQEDFFWQYSENIADLCKLPDFNDDDEEDWSQWLISYQQRPWSHMFAINHRDWGFIGSAGIEIVEGVGFIFYWLGEDFQGYGFAHRAVNCLLDWAGRYLQLTCCYAVVYEDNLPSKKVLDKLNFQPAQLKIADEYDKNYEQEYVYYRGPKKSDRQMFFELNKFFINIGSELRVLALTAASGWR